MFELGANYWPRISSLAMWREGGVEEIENDLRALVELGVRAVRLFVLLRDFIDPDLGLREDALSKLEQVLSAAQRLGMSVYLTLVTVHMSGRNWFDPLRRGSLYSLETLDRLQLFVAELVRRLAKWRCIKCWVLSNELSNVEPPPSRAAYRALVRSLIATIKLVDGSRPVALGDYYGLGREPRSVESVMADISDLHVYYYDNDDVRQSMAYAAMIEWYSSIGKPVVLEEFGCSTTIFDPHTHARFVNAILFTSLMNGARGAFLWCYSDYAEKGEQLLDHHPLELGFGIFKSSGEPKPVAETLKSFALLLDRLNNVGFFDKFVRRPREVAIVVPQHLTDDVEFVWCPRDLEMGSILESFTLAKGVQLPATVVDEDRVFSIEGIRMFVFPSVHLVRATTWRKIIARVMDGAAVYASLMRTEINPHESPCHVLTELFGVEPALPACRLGEPLDECVSMEFVKDFGAIRAGTRIRVCRGRRYSHRLFAVPVKPVSAEVVAVLDSGEPAIVVNRLGKGIAVLSTVPIEALLATNDVVDRASSTVRTLAELYAHIAESIGIVRGFVSSDPRIEIEYFSDGSRCIMFALNHSYSDIEARITSVERILSVDKIGGDAALKSYDEESIELSLPGKSGIALFIE